MADYSLGASSGLKRRPRYILPTYDRRRIGELSEQVAGPEISRLRRGLISSRNRYAPNPIVRSQINREALRGYGEGLGSIRRSALLSAQKLYQPEYQAQLEKSRQNYLSETSEYERNLQEKEQTDERARIDRLNRDAAVIATLTHRTDPFQLTVQGFGHLVPFIPKSPERGTRFISRGGQPTPGESTADRTYRERGTPGYAGDTLPSEMTYEEQINQLLS